MSAEGPSDETPKCQRRPGRPRKYPLLVHPTDVFITVEGPESVACSVHHKSCSCIVRIPNLLINHWNRLIKRKVTPEATFLLLMTPLLARLSLLTLTAIA